MGRDTHEPLPSALSLSQLQTPKQDPLVAIFDATGRRYTWSPPFEERGVGVLMAVDG